MSPAALVADATVPFATDALAGLMTATDKQKLDGIEAGAEVNPDLSSYIEAGDNVSELTNDAGYITDAGVTKITAGTESHSIQPTDLKFRSVQHRHSGLCRQCRCH